VHLLEKHWQRVTAITLLLLPLSMVFAGLSALRRAAYRFGMLQSRRLPVPVVIVGNISVGGTGKTPVVLWLAQALQRRGLTPGIVSRGYGGRARLMEVTGNSDPAQAGDEPVLLASRAACPLVVGRDRVAAAKRLLEKHPSVDVILSDDGLQHYRLARDVEIAVIDSRRAFGNGCLLPAGPLRETQARLHKVDAIVTNGPMAVPAAAPAFSMTLEGSQLHRLRDTSLARALDSFAGEAVHAVAGIGNPQRFFLRLQEAGLTVRPHAFADHHAFSADDLAFLPVIMTEKDAIKCRSFARDNWWMLPVDAQIDPGLADLVQNIILAARGR
jgi:tetraacyldisaccharide 4'-kinase